MPATSRLHRATPSVSPRILARRTSFEQSAFGSCGPGGNSGKEVRTRAPEASACGRTMRLKLLPSLAARWFAACAIVAAAFVTTTSARTQHRPAPLPPPRPADLGRAPAASVPQTSAPQSPSPAPQTAAPRKPDEPLDLDHPPMLPTASRKRMSECGREWEATKKAGKDVDIGWRAFATRCLTR